MPRFLTLSPTHIERKKQHAWENFRTGNYIAIGWMHVDLTGKSIDEVDRVIRSYDFPNERSALDSFRRFLSLEVGDYVAVTNSGQGLFGIGVVTSGYRYEEKGHETGIESTDERYTIIEHCWYRHLRSVEWKTTTYRRRRDLLRAGEKGWPIFGTTGPLLDDLPVYIRRALGEDVVVPPAPAVYKPADWLIPLIEAILTLRKDESHQERAHESLVEEFLVALGYRRHEDIKFRQGRIDIMLYAGGRPALLLEVKRDWALQAASHEARAQAYRYALEQGIRFVGITNGDYYQLFDRQRGLSYDEQLLGEFTLSALRRGDEDTIEKLRPHELELAVKPE
jgi:hypothetical protein